MGASMKLDRTQMGQVEGLTFVATIFIDIILIPLVATVPAFGLAEYTGNPVWYVLLIIPFAYLIVMSFYGTDSKFGPTERLLFE